MGIKGLSNLLFKRRNFAELKKVLFNILVFSSVIKNRVIFPEFYKCPENSYKYNLNHSYVNLVFEMRGY